MQLDPHETFRQIADKSLVGDALPDEERSLGAHLEACASCREYLNAGARAIAGLNGLSFDVDPALQARVNASLARRAVQLEARQLTRRRLVWTSIAALLLTVAGSFIELQFGGLAAAALGIRPLLVRQDLLHIWILPSLSFCLLIPALLALSAAGPNQTGMNRKGRVL